MSRWLTQIRLAVRSLFRRPQVDQELDEEFQYHLERQIEDNLRRGLAPEEARYADRKSTRLNSSHSQISYAVFCLKKKNTPHSKCLATAPAGEMINLTLASASPRPSGSPRRWKELARRVGLSTRVRLPTPAGLALL